METKNVMIVGVGGQGSLLASKLLGALLVAEGYDVKVSEVHGMSQRGGSVVTYVRFGDNVYSPVIAQGEADFIVSFEKIEAARYAANLRKDGKIIVNSQMIDPMPVITGAASCVTRAFSSTRSTRFPWRSRQATPRASTSCSWADSPNISTSKKRSGSRRSRIPSSLSL